MDRECVGNRDERRFSRQCLANCLCRPRTIKGPHLAEILAAVSSAKALRQILGQPLHEHVPIGGTLSSFLFELDNRRPISQYVAVMAALILRATARRAVSSSVTMSA